MANPLQLLASYGASDSEDEEEEEATSEHSEDERLRSHGESKEGAVDGGPNGKQLAVSKRLLLPSASELLADETVKPDFLPKKPLLVEFYATESGAQAVTPSKKRLSDGTEGDSAGSKARKVALVNGGMEAKKAAPLSSPSGRSLAAQSTDSKSEDRKTKERQTAKERVKNQRVKGQAGIGSDFRTWKSETEMQLRQQFD